ncbi:DUF192 domain-containing protein [Parerythrobacter jejuensis]|uniref:DUF192 domain-containing protein n=1 Tax=Parerythrobacter jejuensis TaxID=795812 RepID=A0A845AKQ6_9SPHN|nr:DUF192 domain-containing protein [Parerythrobacter jejuensis]MXP31342.1 DUF192 domain-containing protein [Parerythrobacter jejuensis]MXP34102.1 DUF192 domain-containing protein [Parerythrobacter jejuensis]
MGTRSLRLRHCAALLGAGLLLACSPQAGAEAAAQAERETTAERHPVSGLRIVPLTVESGDTVHRFKAEVANTPEAQARGLMFRTELGPDEAMIFPRDGTESARFWMKNTPLPLDIIFIGPNGRISNIAAMTTPYSLDGVESEGVVTGVLELVGGRAAELGISPGDKVEW